MFTRKTSRHDCVYASASRNGSHLRSVTFCSGKGSFARSECVTYESEVPATGKVYGHVRVFSAQIIYCYLILYNMCILKTIITTYSILCTAVRLCSNGATRIFQKIVQNTQYDKKSMVISKNNLLSTRISMTSPTRYYNEFLILVT